MSPVLKLEELRKELADWEEHDGKTLRRSVKERIRACAATKADWRFFQIVNHSVPLTF